MSQADQMHAWASAFMTAHSINRRKPMHAWVGIIYRLGAVVRALTDLTLGLAVEPAIARGIERLHGTPFQHIANVTSAQVEQRGAIPGLPGECAACDLVPMAVCCTVPMTVHCTAHAA